MSRFLSSDDGDIHVIRGYAGTGKTTAISAVVSVLTGLKISCVLLAPTGRAAKVLSRHTGRHAGTIHKQIYRQKSVGADGFGQFSLAPNKSRDTLFIVDEVSLIGIEAGQQSITAFGSGNLLEDLVTFVRAGSDCKMILIGDDAQLPPIGLESSPALSEEYMSVFGGVSFSRMTDVVRQQAESGILRNATMLRERISEGETDVPVEQTNLSVEGFDDIERISGGELIDALSSAYSKYGEDETVVICRSNKRALRYNAGIRSMVEYKEEKLLRGDKLMVVKNCYQFLEDVKEMDYIANGDIVRLEKIWGHEERYGLHFASARLSFPDYEGLEIEAKVILDTLESESASLSYEQSNALYQGVSEDYSHLKTKKKIYEAVREDPYFNALQLKYAEAITCHKSQGGEWRCVFIDNPVWQDFLTTDDLKWLYTAITRGVEKVFLVNFKDEMFLR
ncbi:MAG: AAA family ATPase [Bacteroidales bacterium]|nr:AAA family ATPase [Bacteroidales bacterium]